MAKQKLKAQSILALVLENHFTPLLIIDDNTCPSIYYYIDLIRLSIAHKNLLKKNMSSLQKALETAHQEQPPAFAQIGGTAKKKKKKKKKSQPKKNVRRTVMMPVKPKIVISTPAHDDDDSDDGSCSSSSSSSDDSSVDTNEEEQKQQQNNDSEDMIKIRQQAFNLLNKSSGPTPNNNKSRTNGFSVSSYQQQSPGEQSTNTTNHNTNNTHFSSSYQSSPYEMHNPNVHPNARTAEKMSMTDLIVNCVSDVCRSSSSEILSKGVSLVSAGYKSVSNYGDTPVSGTFDSIDTSQHGYGNSNNVQRAYPARYQD